MGLFDLFKKAVKTATDTVAPSPFLQIINKAFDEYQVNGTNYWDIKANTSSPFNDYILPLSDKEKVAFIKESISEISISSSGRTSWSSGDKSIMIENIWSSYLSHLLKIKLNLDDEDMISILDAFCSHKRYSYGSIFHWPVSSLINQIAKQSKTNKPSAALIKRLEEFKASLTEYQEQLHESKDKTKLVEKIDIILFGAGDNEDAVKPTWFPAEDAFGKYANESIKAMKDDVRQKWFVLMLLSQRGSGASPSAKFLSESRQAIKDVGDDFFKQHIADWFQFIINLKEETTEHRHTYNGTEYINYTTEFIATINIDMIKGFVWMCTPFYNKSMLLQIASLADRTFRKIPGKGPASTGIGNACLYVLAKVKGLDGVGHLSRLKLRIKQSSTQNLIEKYLQQAAKEQGVSIEEIEDMAVSDYDLVHGAYSWELEGFTARLTIAGIGKTQLQWYKADGSLQKAVPTIVKEKQAAKLKKIKETIQQVELSLTAQRDRIDRMLKVERKLSWQQFNDYYFEHGLMSFIAHKLVWIFEEDDTKYAAIYINHQWQNTDGKLQYTPSEKTMVRLWHPVFETVYAIQNWRQFLMDQQIVQPLKQVFREVYLLTDAEINTNTYSNRMAAHILKQHQFNSLAKIRGWKYALMGCFDNGIDSDKASLLLPNVGLKAEYWINEVNAEDATNDTGIWLYVATDQIRFISTQTNEVVELIDVPALVFSEVMRDVDLFVGVASVGNDPSWSDNGGLPAYRNYWEAYSFGDLTELAKTRKAILEKLVPRLKIASVCEIKDKFLVVKGKLRTYKIHIGSTNILMEPNDQYLCIVPARSKEGTGTDKLFLPFEGDNGISLIISKAMLLAADDVITDTTITSQIKRK